MLPITQANSSFSTGVVPATSSTDLARQPLQLNCIGIAENDAVKARIVDVLCDQRSDDDTVAAIFINAHNGGYQASLNRLIREIEGVHGFGSVVINDHVREILDNQRIRLATSEEGTVCMRLAVPLGYCPIRQSRVERSLNSTLPPPVINIIESYDGEVDLSQHRQQEIIEIFRSRDLVQINEIIDAVIERDNLRYLDQVYFSLRALDRSVKLTGVDLHKLIRHYLQFHAKNGQMLHSVIPIGVDAMTKAGRDDLASVQFLKNIFDHEHEQWVNSELEIRVRADGIASVLVNANVKHILAAKGIELVQSDINGRITLRGAYATTDEAEQRATSIDDALNSFPKELTKIIAEFDAPLKICKKNKAIMVEILNSNDPAAKAELIAAASHQGQIKYLNAVMNGLKSADKLLDLSNVDLKGLNLREIELSLTNLTNANFQDTDLTNANLSDSLLMNANLNGAIAVKARLVNADLSNASAIGANFTAANLVKVNLDGAKLQLARFVKSDLGKATAHGAYLGFTNLKNAKYDLDFLMDAHWTVEENGMSGRFA